MSAERETIEVLTPGGPGGIAVLSLAGPDRQARAARLLRSIEGRPIEGPIGTRPRLGLLCLEGEAIDRVLVFDRPQGATLEIHLHGSPSLLAALADQVDLRPPSPSPTEALLQGAMSEGQLRLALEQTDLDWAGCLAGMLRLGGAARLAEVAAACERSRIALCHAQPCPLVLCGATNAGKSTLMNRLLFMERCLTGPQPGLTRDPVRELTCLSGYPYLLIDTAGEGPAASEIDHLAQERARRELGAAKLRLLVVDGNRGPGAAEIDMRRDPCLVLRNKMDLAQAAWPERLNPCLRISAEHQSPVELRGLIGEALRELRGLPLAGAVGGPAALDGEQLAALEALV